VDGLVTAFGLVVPDLSAYVYVAASQFLTAVLRRSLEPGQYLSAAYIGMLASYGIRSVWAGPVPAGTMRPPKASSPRSRLSLFTAPSGPRASTPRQPSSMTWKASTTVSGATPHSTTGPAEFEADHHSATLAA
jgi:hypothetical protein